MTGQLYILVKSLGLYPKVSCNQYYHTNHDRDSLVIHDSLVITDMSLRTVFDELVIGTPRNMEKHTLPIFATILLASYLSFRGLIYVHNTCIYNYIYIYTVYTYLSTT